MKVNKWSGVCGSGSAGRMSGMLSNNAMRGVRVVRVRASSSESPKSASVVRMARLTGLMLACAAWLTAAGGPARAGEAGATARASEPASRAAALDFAFVTTTDFITGSSSVIWLDGNCTVQNNVASLHSDAVCRYFGGLLYVVNRSGGDNIQILDPNNNFATIRQFSVGALSDPHDINVVSPTKAYVTRYNETQLWIVDPSTGVHTGSIDMSGFNDVDGLPEMDLMARVGDHVFVTVQRLDRNAFFTPVAPSYVVVIDITTDAIVDVDAITPGIQSIALAGTNPFSEIQLDPWSGRLYVSSVAFFGVQDGGVEVIDPVTFQTGGFIFTEAAAGGDINDVEIMSDEKGYAIVADAAFNTLLIGFNPQTGVKTGTLFAPGGFVLNDIELSPGRVLFLADRTAIQPGIRKFDVISDTELTANPIDVGLPPFDICFSVPIQTGVGGTPAMATALGANYPNPFNPVTTIPFSLERAGRVELTIYDVHGRLVRRLLDESREAGANSAVWDGRDDTSRPVASGVYFVRLRSGGAVAMRKLVLLK